MENHQYSPKKAGVHLDVGCFPPAQGVSKMVAIPKPAKDSKPKSILDTSLVHDVHQFGFGNRCKMAKSDDNGISNGQSSTVLLSVDMKNAFGSGIMVDKVAERLEINCIKGK